MLSDKKKKVKEFNRNEKKRYCFDFIQTVILCPCLLAVITAWVAVSFRTLTMTPWTTKDTEILKETIKIIFSIAPFYGSITAYDVCTKKTFNIEEYNKEILADITTNKAQADYTKGLISALLLDKTLINTKNQNDNEKDKFNQHIIEIAKNHLLFESIPDSQEYDLVEKYNLLNSDKNNDLPKALQGKYDEIRNGKMHYMLTENDVNKDMAKIIKIFKTERE